MRKLITYIILGTALLAHMDFDPIHYAWWHYGQYPSYAQNWEYWTKIRTFTAMVLCPPCGALAENYYYVLMEKEAGEEEQKEILKGKPYTHNPINPHGDWSFWWGQGEGRPWRQMSMLSWYLWWLPYTVIWWFFARHVFFPKDKEYYAALYDRLVRVYLSLRKRILHSKN